MEYKKFFYKTLFGIILTLMAICTFVIIVDPQFHYHKPLEGLSYEIYSQRYQNDGILRNFDYNAIITGTSMTENFKSSEMDELFGVQSVKIPFSGGYYKEIDENIKRAVDYNDKIKLILRTIDPKTILTHKDATEYASFPDYLYDDNLLNDVEYIFNNYTIFEYICSNVFLYTRDGKETTSFDKYSNWQHKFEFSKKAVLDRYIRRDAVVSGGGLTEDEKEMVWENIEQNFIATAKQNPNIGFYYFFPPYSVVYFDEVIRDGTYEKRMEAMAYATELMLECENIRVFSFWDNYGLITDLSNYKDYIHFSEDVNSLILQWISKSEGLLTRDNYKQHFEEIYNYYYSYDYNAIFK